MRELRPYTSYGAVVADGALRGERPESQTGLSVLTVGLFDGIAALRVAMDLLGAQAIGHVSVELSEYAHRVVQSHFPGTVFINTVQEVDESMVEDWRCKFGQCDLVILGGGPPCQGVSGLNYDRRGALHDHRSDLFPHVARIRQLLQQKFTCMASSSQPNGVGCFNGQGGL